MARRLCVAVAMTGLAAAAPGQTTPSSTSSNALSVTLEQFGLAGHYRPGSIAPVRLQLNYSGDKPVQGALVTIEQPDSDGDIQEISQTIALNAGRNFTTLYVPLAYGVSRSTVWDVVVYAYENDRRGQELAAVRIGPQTGARDPDTAVLGVVGTRVANLSSYVPSGNSSPIPVTGHEPVQILSDIRTENLPDRWMGYGLLDALVWTQGDPVELTIDQAEAIRQWVERGGHFIVVLPEVGDAWHSTRLDPIMPEVVVRRVEGFELTDNLTSGGLLRLMSYQDTIAPNAREPRYPIFNLHLFEPVGRRWSDSTTIPFMEIDWPDLTSNTAGRKSVVVQREVGMGRVTLIGIPVINATLNRPGLALPNAEVFWNQILGYRRDLPDSDDIKQAQQGGSRAFSGLRNRYPAPLSEPLPSMIELSATASRGLLLALVVFIAYWLISGPGAFAFLQMKHWSRYNWVAFVGIAGVFTGISWAGASWLRSSEIRPIHVTFLDHVAGTDFERSTSWVTVALNGYSSRHVAINGESAGVEDPGLARRSIMRVLSVPGESVAPFPDVRHYQVNSSNQSAFDIPARSTSKSLYISALHPQGQGWGMPTFKLDAERPHVDDEGQLRGILVHDLPGTLQDVTVYYVANMLATAQRRGSIQARGYPRLRVYAVRLTGGQWAPGVPFDLSKMGDVRGGDVSALVTRTNWFGKIGDAAGRPHHNYGVSFSLGDKQAALDALTFFRALDPPLWDGSGRSGQEDPQFLRPMGREVDLSEWLTRPCVIITGFLQGSPLPYPMSIDGMAVDEADPRSLTLVRWVYPLPVEEAPRAWTDPNANTGSDQEEGTAPESGDAG